MARWGAVTGDIRPVHPLARHEQSVHRRSGPATMRRARTAAKTRGLRFRCSCSGDARGFVQLWTVAAVRPDDPDRKRCGSLRDGMHGAVPWNGGETRVPRLPFEVRAGTWRQACCAAECAADLGWIDLQASDCLPARGPPAGSQRRRTRPCRKPANSSFATGNRGEAFLLCGIPTTALPRSRASATRSRPAAGRPFRHLGSAACDGNPAALRSPSAQRRCLARNACVRRSARAASSA